MGGCKTRHGAPFRSGGSAGNRRTSPARIPRETPVGAGAGRRLESPARDPARRHHLAATHLRHHFASGRGQDHADGEAPALRRRHPAGRRGQGARRAAARALRLDEGGARARHQRDRLGDDVRVGGTDVQPAGHAGPRGLQRGHLPHADRRRLGGDGHRRRQGHRGTDAQTVRGVPAPGRADHHVHQQAGSRGPRSLRSARRDRADPAAARHPCELAHRHGARFSRRVQSPLRSPDPDGARRKEHRDRRHPLQRARRPDARIAPARRRPGHAARAGGDGPGPGAAVRSRHVS